MAEKQRWENPPFNERRADLLVNNRKAPTSRLMTRLGLKGFNNKGPLRETAVQTGKVGIALKQHIGAPVRTDRYGRPERHPRPGSRASAGK